MKIINTKFTFAFLIISLILGFVVISFINTQPSKITNVQNNSEEDSKKIIGVEIRQQNKEGTKFLIVADTLEETNTEFNTIKLENSYTTIDQKGILTNISAGHAIITNNYENFDFSDNVVIVKKIEILILKAKHSLEILTKVIIKPMIKLT